MGSSTGANQGRDAGIQPAGARSVGRRMDSNPSLHDQGERTGEPRCEREHMLSGRLYDASDPELAGLRVKAHELCRRFNASGEEDRDLRENLLGQLIPDRGQDSDFMGPIYFDYGVFTTLGSRIFANFNFTVLDTCPVVIGDDVMIGPNVTLATPIHPMRWQERNLRRKPDGSLYDWEYGAPITIGANCWIASNVVICGGVTVGEGSVIGAGSVVTHDIPENSLAVGNPCMVLRTITEAERMDLPEPCRPL